ncbi:metal-dependent phosphohydrolase, partial [Streptomyces sp. SID5606]|nr:metal-dependent phosphohydrolase [Streptomyces sp. SID5606]
MDAVSARARAYVGGIALLALVALLCPRPPAEVRTSWWAVLLLAGLYAGSELVARSRFVGTCYPVLLAGAFLLPPPAAALVALPGALLAPVTRRPAGLRRIWRAAWLTLAVWAAARV